MNNNTEIELIRNIYKSTNNNYIARRGAYLEAVEFGDVELIKETEKEFTEKLTLKLYLDSILQHAPVFNLLLSGKTIKEIAKIKNKSIRTIYRILNNESSFVINNTEAILTAVGSRN
jgi:hypothetical protein